MRICPHCGGFFDETLLICPIDGYDFSIAIKEEKRKKIIAIIRNISKHVFCASTILSIITSLLILALSGVFSNSSSIQERIDYVSAKTGLLFSEDNSFQQRIGYIGSDLKTINSRFQDVYIKKGEIKIHISGFQENAAIAENRLAVFHIDLDRITRRWLFAVNQGELHYNSIRTISD